MDEPSPKRQRLPSSPQRQSQSQSHLRTSLDSGIALPLPTHIDTYSYDGDQDTLTLPLPSPSASPNHNANASTSVNVNVSGTGAAVGVGTFGAVGTLSPLPEAADTADGTDIGINTDTNNSTTEKDNLLAALVHALPQGSPGDVGRLINALIAKADTATRSEAHLLLAARQRRDPLTVLPPEITHKLLTLLQLHDLATAMQVSKTWHRIITRDDQLWRNLAIADSLITENESESHNDNALSLYECRRRTLNRWMDPHYTPRRYLLNGGDDDSLNVITCLQFDAEKIAAGSNVNHILLYETSTGKLLRTLRGHTGGVWAMKFYGNVLASGSTDRTVRIWNIRTGKCTHVFKGHTSTVRCLEIIEPQQTGTDDMGRPIVFPASPLLITGSRDATLYVWRLPMGDDSPENDGDAPLELDASTNPYLVTILKGHTASVRAVTGHANILVSGSYDSTARVWDLRTGECLHVLQGQHDRIYSCVLDGPRNRCYTGSANNTVRVWDLRTGETVHILEGHQILVGLITSSRKCLVSAAADSTVRIWDPDTGLPRHVLRGHTSAITCVANDDFRVLSGSQGMLKLWDARTGEMVRELVEGVDGPVWQVAFDWRRCVAAVQRGERTVIEVVDFGDPTPQQQQQQQQQQTIQSQSQLDAYPLPS